MQRTTVSFKPSTKRRMTSPINTDDRPASCEPEQICSRSDAGQIRPQCGDIFHRPQENPMTDICDFVQQCRNQSAFPGRPVAAMRPFRRVRMFDFLPLLESCGICVRCRIKGWQIGPEAIIRTPSRSVLVYGRAWGASAQICLVDRQPEFGKRWGPSFLNLHHEGADPFLFGRRWRFSLFRWV